MRRLIFILALTLAQSTPALAINTEGLVGYWKFDESSGSVRDYSGLNHHGSIRGSVPWVPGFIGQAYSFNGVAANKIIVPRTNAIDITGETVTILAWVKVAECPPSGVYGEIVKHLQTSTPGGFQLELNGSENCTIRFNYRDGNDTFTSGPGIRLTPGVWYHVAGGKNKTHIWTAINGAIDLFDDSVGSIKSNSQDLVIGGQISAGSGGTTFNGLIDEVRLFNRALTPAEVNEIYLEGLTPNSTPGAPRNFTIEP